MDRIFESKIIQWQQQALGMDYFMLCEIIIFIILSCWYGRFKTLLDISTIVNKECVIHA